MATRVILVIAGVFAFIGMAYMLLALFAVRSVENGVSRHIIDGTGITRGASLIILAVVLAVIAFVVRSGR
ncbi:MAG: hypothetical protein OJF49_001850 [Ktedonobacterales bacterium]|jgi:hypothetical protein|nr:MAG: hypothetical protein OJF49_001850 [Ktedonobacterales bacterium]